ncbi:hypothetical protein ACFQ1I_31640 [Kitasatospora arboriphila]
MRPRPGRARHHPGRRARRRPHGGGRGRRGRDPSTVLDLWLTAAGIVRELAVDTDLLDIEGEGPGEGAGAGAAGDADDEDAAESALAEVEEASEAAAELLDEALQVLYELTAFAEPGEETVPLGVLAALLVVPEGEEPDEEMLGQITDLMVELDPMLADLAELGLVEHRPIDPELFEEEEEGEEAAPAAEAAASPARRTRPASASSGSPRSASTASASGCSPTATTPR